MAKKKQNGGRKKRLGRPSVRASSRQRAARAGKSDMVLPGRRKAATASAIDPDSDGEIFGVLLSERRRRGESNPTVPESKTKNTRSTEAKKTGKRS